MNSFHSAVTELQRVLSLWVLASCILLSGCGQPPDDATLNTSGVDKPSTPDTAPAKTLQGKTPQPVSTNHLRNAYFGDLHVHTMLSVDAYLWGSRATPDDSYRFAKGAALLHPAGFMVQRRRPLDFLAVTDHGFYLGLMGALAEGKGAYADHELVPIVRAVQDQRTADKAFWAVARYLLELDLKGKPGLRNPTLNRDTWQQVVAAAEHHNAPGQFTTFAAYEYTSSGQETENLHRNVIFRGSQVPAELFTRLDSSNPEDLWGWMDAQRTQGNDSLAIPHNSNGSNGWMFEKTQFMSDEPLNTSYAEQRMRNEPVVENTQVKGTSDTHPLLSPNDEWADFEIMPYRVAYTLASEPQGSYVRRAYLDGLQMLADSGFNPYRFGVIGSSDTHTAAGSTNETNYWGKTGLTDGTPESRGSVPVMGKGSEKSNEVEYADTPARFWGASGLAGVWAEANTREALFAALQRKEVFSTTGPFIQVRFFAGYRFDEAILTTADPVAQAYAGGVPMGSELQNAKTSQSPGFFVWALADTNSQALQRLQIVKGYMADGVPQEKVIDVHCANGSSVDPATGRCPDNGAQVNLTTCATRADVGDQELRTYWEDPDFDATQPAFYYVRVLENPSCRWSTWDAIRNGTAPHPDVPPTIQERAWSSPIWYEP